MNSAAALKSFNMRWVYCGDKQRMGREWGEYLAWRNIFYYCTTCSSVLNISTHTMPGGVHVCEHTYMQYAHIQKDTHSSPHHKFRNTALVPPGDLFVGKKILFFPPPRSLWFSSSSTSSLFFSSYFIVLFFSLCLCLFILCLTRVASHLDTSHTKNINSAHRWNCMCRV